MGKKTEQKEKRSGENQTFAVVSYVFIAFFLAMAAYLIWFLMVPGDEFINNSYNKRIRTLSAYVERGGIRTKDGVLIAETETDDAGEEHRRYPYGAMFSHAVGFYDNGGMGVEKDHNYDLLKSHELIFRRIAADLSGAKSRGDDVITTLDFDAQKAAYEAMGDYRGAVIAMEVETGRIVALVSKPDFDPAAIRADWNALTEEESAAGVFVNRAMNGLYPPGSVFKIVTTLEYMREAPGYEAYTYTCDGAIDRGDGTALHCYGNEAHGTLDLGASFAKSCNTSYANIALMLDRTRWRTTAEELLFNGALPASLGASESVFSVSDADSRAKIAETGIGQGDTLVTPVHICMIAQAVANGGVMMKPYLVDAVESTDGVYRKERAPQTLRQVMRADEADALLRMMEETVQSGTARGLQSDVYQAAGKTGSAEYGLDKGASHGWFAGCASVPDGKKPALAIAVIAEDGNTGAASAVPIAKAVFDAYFSR